MDRWLAGPQAWRLRRPESPPLVVDLGYGASPVTTVELRDRLRRVRADIRVVGIEIDPARVAAAQPLAGDGLSFRLGGFELPLDEAEQPTVVRAFNVLRQYAEDEVPAAWDRLRQRLTPDGLLVDGTCDELGRLSSWVALDRTGPLSLTVSLRLADLDLPSVVAERLPKVLIHHNVPGEPVHAYLAALDDAWRRSAAYASYGARQRFVASVEAMRAAGWPVIGAAARWRLGELTVPWTVVRPSGWPGQRA